MKLVTLTILAVINTLAWHSSEAQTNAGGAKTYRLYHGITAYIDNPQGKDFDLTLDLRDINLVANGPREVLFKVYDPEGTPVVREIIQDDGIVSRSYMPRIGGWDHELDYYALCYSRGTLPMLRWSAPSEPKRLAAIEHRIIRRSIKSGKKGAYRVVLVGERDHYVTLRIEPKLNYGICGHHTWLHGYGEMWRKSFIYVPRGTVGLHLAFAEPDVPRSRRFTLTGPDGRNFFDGAATGSFIDSQVKFDKPGQYDDQLLTLQVSDGPGDYLLHITLQRVDGDYVGMGTEAVLAPDEATARALRGGAIYEDDKVFWHPFQVRLHRWLKINKLGDATLDADIRKLANLMITHIGPSDGRGAKSWTNWGYAFGYYGCRIWRPGWLLMKRAGVPHEIKDLIRECFLVGGDRLSFAIGIERVNGNAFAQIPVALWYCQQATGDALQKQRFETFFERWRTEGWGEGSGISKSGDSQEHFAHDNHYGSYILSNWLGGTWVKHGILSDTDDPRFETVIERIRDLYTYLYCDQAAANPWSSRTSNRSHQGKTNWLFGGRKWKGEPGSDFTVSVNGGDEWFAARRKTYYVLTFHGRLPPQWLCNTFHGQIGFGGGILCQLTVPGKGTVLASTLNGDYGKGMHLSNWRNFRIHSIVGQMWNGEPLVTGVSEHHDAGLEGNMVSSSGEVRGRPIRSARKYTFEDESIVCEVKLGPTSYKKILTMWSGVRPLSHVKEAYEMIPFLKAKVALVSPDGILAGDLTTTPTEGSSVIIDRGGYGVRIEFDKPRNVLRGANNTVLIQLADKKTPAGAISLNYRLVPFVGKAE